ncbi:TRPM8 channel-associated factor homolog [Melanotaenia boesemani]|uniref:TRPM8 channel-associated factor homolog n=1 Tax=Melanotaenia boesemani TaxID=1250792 RepID=UPI001C047387|nr:TRPM8 channel-associated factor homolog [Melanotaenia boesemani]
MSNKPTQFYHEEAYRSVMTGVKELDLRGSSVPCNLLLTGENAFPLLMNSYGQVLMAASSYGRGRIVVLSHESYLFTFPALVEKALNWLRGGESGNPSVGIQKSLQAVADKLNRSVFQVSIMEAFSESLGVGAFVTDAYSVGANPRELVAFLKSGGGVLMGGQAWNWAANNPDKNTILQFPGNKVSGVAGIYFTSEYGNKENLPIYPEIPSSWRFIDVGKNFEDDLEFLLKGISGFELHPDLACSEALVHGPLAFPIGITEGGRALLAGSYYGLGRVVLVTHESLLQTETMSSFWRNAVHWLDQGRNGVIGFDQEGIILPNLELNCEKTRFRPDLSVYVCTAYSDEHVEEIQNFVAEGGGLLIGGHAWWWASTNPEQNPFQDFSGNKILNKMGLSLLTDTLNDVSYKCSEPSQVSQFHFRRLLRRFADHVTDGKDLTKQEEDLLPKLQRECSNFLSMKAYNSFFYRQVLLFLTDMLKKFGIPQVSEQNPVKTPKDRLLLEVATKVFNVSQNQDALLPFFIKDNPSLPVSYNQRIKINAKTAENEEWISTGLYLPPGMKTYTIMPSKLVNNRWQIQISCQSDVLIHEHLKRPPSVCERYPVTSEVMQVWNLWGGLIYLVAPRDIKVDGEEVIVQVAVPAPYFKSGVTTADDWSMLRAAPAPWAELEFDNIILTVPSHIVRDLERPHEVEKLWNDIMKGVADLAALPQKFDRKERIVADVQISAGWMHSGYPVMMPSSIAAELFRPQDAKTKGLWGETHELGHNQQRICWEFEPHTTEATCNLWSVYVHEEVLGLNRAKAHPEMTLEKRKHWVDEYVKEGRNLEKWNVWTCLETYLQLQGKFGWDAFKKVFAAYHDMSNFPKDNKGKMNLYAETFSQTVKMNLSEFFKAWGWPIEKATEEKLSNLPPWRDHPMVQYS